MHRRWTLYIFKHNKFKKQYNKKQPNHLTVDINI